MGQLDSAQCLSCSLVPSPFPRMCVRIRFTFEPAQKSGRGSGIFYHVRKDRENLIARGMVRRHSHCCPRSQLKHTDGSTAVTCVQKR